MSTLAGETELERAVREYIEAIEAGEETALDALTDPIRARCERESGAAASLRTQQSGAAANRGKIRQRPARQLSLFDTTPQE